LLVFAVLLFLFREWLISVLILFISVMGITGCVLGLFFAGIPLNMSSYTGIIMIVGRHHRGKRHLHGAPVLLVASRDGQRGHGHPLRHCPARPPQVDGGHRGHLDPLAAGLGIGLGAQMQQPLAVAVIGGFVVALPMLLFVLPTGMRLNLSPRAPARDGGAGNVSRRIRLRPLSAPAATPHNLI
jgi:cobalt-zinc-cadmium resistance protein CzcA